MQLWTEDCPGRFEFVGRRRMGGRRNKGVCGDAGV